MPAGIYGNLIRLDTGNGIVEEVLERVPLYAGISQGGVSEDTLQDLLFRFPRALPISAIDATYGEAIPVCRELPTPAGFLDALYVNHLGWLTLAEFKLWRNPQARREVIGQILDYAKDLASWGYEDLQRRVSLATGRKGNALYELVREHHPDLDEAEFVDSVTRHLRRGEFLLLIIGDGIQEGAANIVDFVQRYSGLHFNLALVEAALYRDGANRLIVQPRVLAQTEIVQRFVVDGSVERVAVIDDADTQQETLSDQDEENLRFWTAVLRELRFRGRYRGAPPAGQELNAVRDRTTFRLCRLGPLLRRIYPSQRLRPRLLPNRAEGPGTRCPYLRRTRGVLRGTAGGDGRRPPALDQRGRSAQDRLQATGRPGFSVA